MRSVMEVDICKLTIYMSEQLRLQSAVPSYSWYLYER